MSPGQVPRRCAPSLPALSRVSVHRSHLESPLPFFHAVSPPWSSDLLTETFASSSPAPVPIPHLASRRMVDNLKPWGGHVASRRRRLSCCVPFFLLGLDAISPFTLPVSLGKGPSSSGHFLRYGSSSSSVCHPDPTSTGCHLRLRLRLRLRPRPRSQRPPALLRSFGRPPSGWTPGIHRVLDIPT